MQGYNYNVLCVYIGSHDVVASQLSLRGRVDQHEGLALETQPNWNCKRLEWI